MPARRHPRFLSKSTVLGGGGGSLTPAAMPDNFILGTDTIPNFAKNYTTYTTRSGNWSDGSLWSTGHVPTVGEIAVVVPSAVVTYNVISSDSLSAVAIQSGGTLTFATSSTTKLTVRNLMLFDGGTLTIGTDSAPVTGLAEIVFPNVPLPSFANDPYQWSNGLLTLGDTIGCMFNACGSPRDGFYMLATDPVAGNTSVTINTPAAGWRVGDTLLVADTRYLNQTIRQPSYTFHGETPTISGVSADSKTFALSAPLAYDHPSDNIDSANKGHVGNLTRNVVFRSVDSASTTVRGHVAFLHGSVVMVCHSRFQNLGRTFWASAADEPIFPSTPATNKRGRYPCHTHHLMGMGSDTPLFTIQSNVVIDEYVPSNTVAGLKQWGINIHFSHYGLIEDNVVFNMGGAGITTEDGNETRNVFDHNWVCLSNGTGDKSSIGQAGDGFWFRGSNNYVTNNVASSMGYGNVGSSFGYNYQLSENNNPPTLRPVPTAPGQPEDQWTPVDLNTQGVLQFEDNTTYSTPYGHAVWFLGMPYVYSGGPADSYSFGAPESVFLRCKIWGVYQKGVYPYPCQHVTYRNFQVHGDNNWAPFDGVEGLGAGDYSMANFQIYDSDFRGINNGWSPSTASWGEQILGNCTFQCASLSIYMDMPWSVSGGGVFSQLYSDSVPLVINVDNCKFLAVPGSAVTPYNYYMQTRGDYSSADIIAHVQFYVTDHNQAPGNDFRVWFNDSTPTFVLPQTGSLTGLYGSPTPGLTNQQNHDTYGLSFAGYLMPAGTSATATVKGRVETATITVTSPTSGGSSGTNITINGAYGGFIGAVEASFNGGAYATIGSVTAHAGSYSGTLTGQATGNGVLTVRSKNAPSVDKTVTNLTVS